MSKKIHKRRGKQNRHQAEQTRGWKKSATRKKTGTGNERPVSIRPGTRAQSNSLYRLRSKKRRIESEDDSVWQAIEQVAAGNARVREEAKPRLFDQIKEVMRFKH
jgi:hypothetical protein